MLVKKNKNMLKVYTSLRRDSLIASTSLELFKQRKLNETVRARNRVFAKQFLSNTVREALQRENSFAVVVKCVQTGSDWANFLNTLALQKLQIAAILPINSMQALYSSLALGGGLNWLIPYLASSAVYVLTLANFADYLALVKHCINYETNSGAGGVFFEVLFLKEQRSFIDLAQHNHNSFSKELRSLYLMQTKDAILLELQACIFSIPSALSAVFSVTLVGPSSSLSTPKL